MLEMFLKKLTANSETKPFYTTSEFWVTAGAVVTAAAGWIPSANTELRTAIIGVAAGAYALARGMAKAGVKPEK